VALHNCAEDIWLAVFGKVYDLTAFVRENQGAFLAGWLAAVAAVGVWDGL
jgi:hypothetical protein